MLRPLSIMGLDDRTARSIGVAVTAGRLVSVGIAVWIATTVAAQVGVIGFVGLAAPALAGMSGARSFGQRLIAAPAIGALLLWNTDGLVQLFAGTGGERVPTGAAAALLGGPLLLWILPRLRMMEWPILASVTSPATRTARPALTIALLFLAAMLAAALALTIGMGRKASRSRQDEFWTTCQPGAVRVW